MDCKGPIVGLEFQRTPARTKSQFTRNITFTTLKYLFHHQSKKSISHKDTTRKPSMTMENQPFEDVSLIQKNDVPLPCWFSLGVHKLQVFRGEYPHLKALAAGPLRTCPGSLTTSRLCMDSNQKNWTAHQRIRLF